jgi:hypothetical protein
MTPTRRRPSSQAQIAATTLVLTAMCRSQSTRHYLAVRPQRVGRFFYRYDTDTWTVGHRRPHARLRTRSGRTDDLAKVKGLLKSAAPFSSRHRIRTVNGDIRKVVVVGAGVTDADRQVVGTRGFYIDITEATHSEIQQTVSDEISAIVAHREVIERAKGMLMLLYHLDVDAAFEVLKWRSQELNIRLHRVAAKLIADCPLC